MFELARGSYFNARFLFPLFPLSCCCVVAGMTGAVADTVAITTVTAAAGTATAGAHLFFAW